MLPACRHSRTPSRCRQWLRLERFFPATSIYDDRPVGRACVKPPATPERGARGPLGRAEPGPCRAGAGPRRLREGRVSARFLRGPGRAAGRTGTACVGSGPSPSYACAHGLRAAGPTCSRDQRGPGSRATGRSWSRGTGLPCRLPCRPRRPRGLLRRVWEPASCQGSTLKAAGRSGAWGPSVQGSFGRWPGVVALGATL